MSSKRQCPNYVLRAKVQDKQSVEQLVRLLGGVHVLSHDHEAYTYIRHILVCSMEQQKFYFESLVIHLGFP